MKVLVSDQLGEIGIRMFQEEEGITVDVKTGLAPEELKGIIGEYHALVIRSATRVTADLIGEAKKLKVVGRAGIGLDNVDIPTATKHGIIVMNTPTGNVVTTAEHAISMMMALTRNIPRGTSSLKSGRWDKKLLQGREVFNKNLGVVGYGKIGSLVADRARGLRMRVIVYDPFVSPEQIQKDGFESVSLEDLYRKADYITIHVHKIKETTGLLNKKAFDQMKNGVMVINCARGGIVNEKDLDDAIASGKVAGAALDVFETEPPGTCSLVEHENVICTPHLGASTKEAQTNVAVAVARQIIDYLKTGTISNAVNAPSVAGELLKKIGPYLNLGDRIGCLVPQLCKGAVKEVDIDYAGDFQGMDLTPITTSVLKGLLTPMVKDDVNYVNANVLAQERGIKVSETTTSDPDEYINLITVRVLTTEGTCDISGTIFGKKRAAIVKIDDFHLTMEPKGHFAYIRNVNKPGAFGSITLLLGQRGLNISRMNVGESAEGDINIVFLATDTPIPDDVLKDMEVLPLVECIKIVEL
ncbi:MAG: phosphoglycerate dehydrogenase [Desulfobacterales bacterium]|nr:phosphoglycerate dehydrogenase [Desulfobacterales bacterium]MDX2512749.1 phosphoglycerate dehydrogenase [Desulfobacterales bacterium]